MPKADPFCIKRKERPIKTFDLKDDNLETSLTLQRFGLVGFTNYQNRAREMVNRYVTGVGPLDEYGVVDQTAKGWIEPKMLPLVDGQPVIVTKTTCEVVAAVEMAQVEPDENERYTFEELVMFCVSDELAEQISDMSAWVMPQGDKKPGNSQAQSDSGASNNTGSTQKSSEGTQCYSGASTNDLEDDQA